MLHEHCAPILASSGLREFEEGLLRFTREMSFDRFGAMVVVDQPGGGASFTSVHNTPSDYLDSYHSEHDCQLDPVMQHCKTRSVPIVWDQATYVRVGQGEMWEVQAGFGYASGIALAMHLPCGLHFMFGVDRDQALPACPQELARLVADVQLFSVYAQETAMRLLAPPRPEADAPGLSARELECLRWTMEGKTSWEVGQILGISEHTTARHLNNATRKLACVNKHQAVLRSLRLGLIR